MFVAIDKITAVRMHGLIRKYWKERIAQLEKDLASISDRRSGSGDHRLDAGDANGGRH